MSDAYNYHHFPEDLDRELFAAFRDHLVVGDRAPDGALIDLASNAPVQLSQLWRSGPLILEFGSLS